jgi:DNA-directed RNA polymerase subunit RPC12/RpoP
MTTVNAFRDAASAHFARSRKLVWTILACTFAFVFSGWFAVQFMPPGNWQLGVQLALIASLVAVVFIAIAVGAICNEGRFGLDARLVCAHCGGRVHLYREFVLETGACPYCHGRVLVDLRKPHHLDHARTATALRKVDDGSAEKTDSTRRRVARLLITLSIYAIVIVAQSLVAMAIAPGYLSLAPAVIVAFIPLSLCAVTCVIFAPGPRRDLVYMTLVETQMGFTVLMFVARSVPFFRLGNWAPAAVAALVVAIGAHGMVRSWRRFLAPERCPGCDRNSLIPAAFSQAVLRSFYNYSWCFRCEGRYKRLRAHGARWLDASGAGDDRFYWMWSARDWLGRRLDQLVGMVRSRLSRS